jgi:hypothetical protein
VNSNFKVNVPTIIYQCGECPDNVADKLGDDSEYYGYCYSCLPFRRIDPEDEDGFPHWCPRLNGFD